MGGIDMSDPQIVTRPRWRQARLELLEQEKEATRARDRVNAARRALPMVEITKDYTFSGEAGPVGLPDLFDGRSQLLIYHFMFGPADDEGCPRCSFMIDNIGHQSHLHARDTTLALVSRAEPARLQAYRDRMGWTLPWYSSLDSDFNFDFHVSFDEAVQPSEYNFRDRSADPAWQGWVGEEQGVSAFLRRGDRVFHTYSGYDRATEILNGTWHWLDLTALGRQEGWEPEPRRGDDEPMGWVQRHDRYV
jgi:predicted dithiol-disulfide oxidoreductase (DUF899 family)